MRQRRETARQANAYEGAGYVFIETENPGPQRVAGEVRKIPGVVRIHACAGRQAVVEGDDVTKMDSVIGRIVEIPGVLDTESRVIRGLRPLSLRFLTSNL